MSTKIESKLKNETGEGGGGEGIMLQSISMIKHRNSVIPSPAFFSRFLQGLFQIESPW